MSKLTWKKTAALVMAVTMLTIAAAGCGNNASSSASSEESSTSSTVESSAASATEEETDEMAAKNVADLIDAIYVQERNDNTDEECKAIHCKTAISRQCHVMNRTDSIHS